MARPEAQTGDGDGEKPDTPATATTDAQSTEAVPAGTGVVSPDVVRPDVVSDTDASAAKDDVVRPGTGVVRPGTDVVRPGTDVVRPGTDVVRPGTGVVGPADAAAAKARAAVPDGPARPLAPIHVVLPVIPVKPAKQSFLDRLVAPKKKKRKADPEPIEESFDDVDEAPGAGSPPPLSPPPASPVQGPSATQAPSRPAQSPSTPSSQSAPSSSAAAPGAVVRPATGAAGSARVDPVRAEAARAEAARAEAVRAEAVRAEAARVEAARAEAARVEAVRAEAARVEAARVEAERALEARLATPPPPTRPGRTAPPSTHPAESGRRQAGGRPPTRHDHQREDYQQYPAHPGSRRPRRDVRFEDSYEEFDSGIDDWADEPRRPLRKGRWVAAAAVLTLLATGGGAFAGSRQRTPPAQWLAATVGAAATVLAGLDGNAPAPSPSGIEARVRPMLSDSRLGGQVAVAVADAATGQVLFDSGADAMVTPASTAKLATAAAVLHSRGPAYRIPTRVVAGAKPGEVVLVGGGDATLAAGPTGTYSGAARLDKLAEQVLKSLDGNRPSRVIVDSTLFQGSTFGPGWIAQDANDGFIANITALMTDGARKNPKQAKRFSQPDVAAGQLFAKALGLPASAVVTGAAPAESQVLGEVLSPPMSRMVEMMLLESDNVLAEALARQVALAQDGPASFAGAAEATRSALADLGVPTGGFSLVDGSGMSHFNKVSARLLIDILVKAAGTEHGELRAIISGLPVAAYSGTLSYRYQGSGSGASAAGTVRAKTGTLSGVNALAGIAVDADGRLLVFSIVANATSSGVEAQYAIDKVAAAIAGCGCR